MNLSEKLKSMHRTSKKDDVPGTVAEILDEMCPVCDIPFRRFKPCCGWANGYKGCSKCGYKIAFAGGSNRVADRAVEESGSLAVGT